MEVSSSLRAEDHDRGGGDFCERWIVIEDSEIKHLLRVRKPERRKPGVKPSPLRSEVRDSQAGGDLDILINSRTRTAEERKATYACTREDDDVLRLMEQLCHVLQRVILWQFIPFDQFPRDANLQKSVVRSIISTLHKLRLSPQSKKKPPR